MYSELLEWIFTSFQMFERETKREKILEGQYRERHQMKHSTSVEDEGGKDDMEELLACTESEFFETVEAEKKKIEDKEKERRSGMFCFQGYTLYKILNWLSGMVWFCYDVSSHQYIPANQPNIYSLALNLLFLRLFLVSMQESGVCKGIQVEHGP